MATRTKGPDRWSPGISLGRGSRPMQAVGGFFAMAADAILFVFRRPFQWREFLEPAWVVAPVSLAPTLLVAIPFTVLVSFTLNILLRELGAADLSGAGAAFGAVTQIGPLVTVLIVAGAGATAMCADLGSRTIREEIDAMEVLGINPVQRLVTPRMLASGLVALLLNSLVCIIGILGGYVFSVFVQHVNPGAFAAGITLLTGVPEVIISCVKAALFGLIAGLVACYRGLTITGGGAKAVGNAVNATGVYAFMALFVVNVVVTAIGSRATVKGSGTCEGTQSHLSTAVPRPRPVPAADRDARSDRRSHHVLRQGHRRLSACDRPLPARDHPVDRRNLHGRRHVGDDRRNDRHRRLLDAGGRRNPGGPGLQLTGQHRHRGADRVPGGVHQRAHLSTRGRGNRVGRHLRC